MNSLLLHFTENDDLPFDIESYLREIEYLLNHDPTKKIDTILEDSVDEDNLVDDLVDTIPEMFTHDHYYLIIQIHHNMMMSMMILSPIMMMFMMDPFWTQEDKIKELKLLIVKNLYSPGSSIFLPQFSSVDSVFYVILRAIILRGPKAFKVIKILKARWRFSLLLSKGIRILDVLIAPDFEASRAHGFVLHSLDLHILSTGYSLKDKNKAKTDKTKHGNGKSMKKSKSKSKSTKKSKSVVSHVLGTKPAGNVNDETTMTNDGNEQASASFIETTGVTHRGVDFAALFGVPLTGAAMRTPVSKKVTSNFSLLELPDNEKVWCGQFLSRFKVVETVENLAPVGDNANERFQKVVKNKRNTNTGPTRPRGGFSVSSCDELLHEITEIAFVVKAHTLVLVFLFSFFVCRHVPPSCFAILTLSLCHCLYLLCHLTSVCLCGQHPIFHTNSSSLKASNQVRKSSSLNSELS
ncbi:hypothetical protein Tco_1217203 [Tanacetum coccineum]